MNHVRHIGIFTCAGWEISLIGAGGIGSPTALALAKMGISRIEVFDDDRVDEVNVAVQMYGTEDIGLYKSIALDSLVRRYAEPVIVPFTYRIDRTDRFTTPIVISAVDSLEARKEIWEAVKQSSCYWYLDARMGAENFQLFSVNMQDTAWYDFIVTNFSDDDVPTEPCTSKATIFTAFIAAGHIGRAVRMIVTGAHKAGVLTHDIRNEELEGWAS